MLILIKTISNPLLKLNLGFYLLFNFSKDIFEIELSSDFNVNYKIALLLSQNVDCLWLNLKMKIY